LERYQSINELFIRTSREQQNYTEEIMQDKVKRGLKENKTTNYRPKRPTPREPLENTLRIADLIAGVDK
jgi:hypothetical protein